MAKQGMDALIMRVHGAGSECSRAQFIRAKRREKEKGQVSLASASAMALALAYVIKVFTTVISWAGKNRSGQVATGARCARSLLALQRAFH